VKQVLQSLRGGSTEVAAVPAPGACAGHVLIATRVSLISAGTERTLVQFGRANVLDKFRQQAHRLGELKEKIRADGLLATIDAVRGKLDQPLPLGYSNVGTVLEAGAGAEEFAVGDRVVSNGRHAETVLCPKHLCARIPEAVNDESASFTVLGAIALQGVRLVQPTLGEVVVVTGLGLIGLLTVQILRANGCRVLGIDSNRERLALAQEFGAQTVDLSAGEDPLTAAHAFSRTRGVDAVILTASTTSSEPVAQAAHMCRKRGRIVLVGVTGLELARADFYEKELSFQVSCSYGPGRYDASYEEHGLDYPIGHVRWTEQRNFEAVLDLMAAGSLKVARLVSHRFDVDAAPKAYDLLVSKEPSLGLLLRYRDGAEAQAAHVSARSSVLQPMGSCGAGRGRVGFIGAGNYGGRILIQAFSRAAATLDTLVSSGGVSAFHFGRKFGFRVASTDADAMLADPTLDTVVICTRHDTHARFALQALACGKNVFVEKPLCLTRGELAQLRDGYARAQQTPRPPILMVGFNRRFAPQVVRMKTLLDGVPGPKSLVMTVNAGRIPAAHWIHDVKVGGGRLIGEACHFIDLLRHLVGAPIISCDVASVTESGSKLSSDSFAVTLRFADGSIGALQYISSGHKGLPKERLEVFGGGRVLQLDNFRRLSGFGWPEFSSMRLWRQDKGQFACVAAFLEAIRSGATAPIAPDDIFEVAEICIALAERM